MRRNIFSIHKQICNVIRNNGITENKRIFYNSKKNFSHHFNKNNNFKTYMLCENSKKKEFINNYNFLLFISLLSIPAFANRRFKTPQNNLVSCSSLERVFLIKKEDIKNGEMKEIKVHNEKDLVLLVNVNNTYYCLGHKCPHYNAPLKSGILTNEYITCPWHDAKFDIKTGECINGPSFDDIPKYEVVVEDDNIYAFLPTNIEIFKEKKVCACKVTCENKCILIVGGGAATLGALETLLKSGYNGKLVICSKDSFKPYDRPVLSKNLANYSNGSELYEEIKLKNDEFYNKSNINYMNNVCITKIDEENKKAYLDNGKVINYDKILITSGVSPRPSPVDNVNSNNLFTLQNMHDNVKISKIAKEGSKCVIIGSGFVGCELSSALKKKNVNVTIVSKDISPFCSVFGDKIGLKVLKILKENDIKFYGNIYPIEYIINKGFMKIKNGNSIHGVRLSNGEVIGCDYVIEALNSVPNSQFLDEKFKNAKDFIVVDQYFKVKNSNDMYAAGDVCVFPYFITDELVNICHWNVAIQQGRIAAHNMISNDKKEFNFIPFFNTNIFGKNFRYCGYVNNYDKIIYEGDLNNHNFVGYFVKNDKVMSILTLGNNKMAALNECLTRNLIPKVYELEGGLKNSDSMIASLKI